MRISSETCEIFPLVESQLRKFHDQERSTIDSTAFSFTRFITTHLGEISGSSLFMDYGTLCIADIEELWVLKREELAVHVCKTQISKKNRQRVLLFNNEKCKASTPQVIESESGLYLHQVESPSDDAQFGALSKEWNYLVGQSARS